MTKGPASITGCVLRHGLFALLACLSAPAMVYGQYQPIEQYPQAERHTPYNGPENYPVSQPVPAPPATPAATNPAQTVSEPDAPDEGAADMSPAMPEPQSIPQPPAGRAAANAAQTPAAAPAGTVNGDTDFTSVTLRALNKVTARAEAIDVPIGSSVRFGTIEIIAHRCWKAAPDERPENAALLEISELKQGEAPVRIFLGWMFSSSPALSALEHPFYDITVIACAKEAAEEDNASHPPIPAKAKKP